MVRGRKWLHILHSQFSILKFRQYAVLVQTDNLYGDRMIFLRLILYIYRKAVASVRRPQAAGRVLGQRVQRAADKLLSIGSAECLRHLLCPLGAGGFGLLIELARHGSRLCTLAHGIREYMHGRERASLQKGQRLRKLVLGLARKADNQIGRNRAVRKRTSQPLDTPVKFLARVVADIFWNLQLQMLFSFL